MALYLSEMAALGVVGFDPLGAIIMLTFIAGGARFGHRLTFTAVNWIMIVVLGVAAGSALDAVLGPLRHWLQSVPRWAWVTVETASAVGLLVWAIVRVRTGLGPDKQGGARSAPLWMLVAIAVGLAVAAFADPGYSGAVLAGSGHPASWRSGGPDAVVSDRDVPAGPGLHRRRTRRDREGQRLVASLVEQIA